MSYSEVRTAFKDAMMDDQKISRSNRIKISTASCQGQRPSAGYAKTSTCALPQVGVGKWQLRSTFLPCSLTWWVSQEREFLQGSSGGVGVPKECVLTGIPYGRRGELAAHALANNVDILVIQEYHIHFDSGGPVRHLNLGMDGARCLSIPSEAQPKLFQL